LTHPFAPFIARRQRVLDHMQQTGGGVAIIPTAREMVRNRDAHFPFRPDSYFHYLSGFPEPEAVLVLVGGDNPRSILFCREKNEEREIWDGYRWGPEAATAQFGVNEAHPVSSFDDKIVELLSDQPTIHFAMGQDPAWDKRIVDALGRVREKTRAGITAPGNIADIHHLLDEMRLIKDGFEQSIMRKAADISAGAHRRAMRASAPGRFEYEVEAELLHAFRSAGSQFPAYSSIVASGPNACVLHYVSNDRRMQDGDLLLIDAGCELDGYASDITRTFPVNGKFTGPQKDIYTLVLEAQRAAAEVTRPGALWNDPHDAAVAVLAQGMVDLGLLKGRVEDIIEKGDYRRFYMHRTGHWLGMDVHDAGEYKLDGQWRALEAGMVLTIEPGCYIRPADDVPEAFWHIGVRIEDDALVTPNGCELITADAPKSVDDIEALMREAA